MVISSMAVATLELIFEWLRAQAKVKLKALDLFPCNAFVICSSIAGERDIACITPYDQQSCFINSDKLWRTYSVRTSILVVTLLYSKAGLKLAEDHE